MSDIAVVILAAGHGKRLRSNIPKVCHKIGGISLIRHVINTASQIEPPVIHVVVGHQKEAVIRECQGLKVNFVTQQEQLGTAHAVNTALQEVTQEKVLVLFGDAPLISEKTINDLIKASNDASLGLLLAHEDNPFGYGRIIKDESNRIVAVVEEKDATESQRQIRDIFAGIMCIEAKSFKSWYPKISNNNAQKEYYLPDIIPLAIAEKEIAAMYVGDNQEIKGVNTKEQLAALEKIYQVKKAKKYLHEGLTLIDPDRVFFRGDVVFGKDCVIDTNVILENVRMSDNVYIGPNNIIKNTNIGSGSNIEANCHIDGAHIDNNCTAGPFARIRPGTKLQTHAKIGNFVEVKNSSIGEDSKVNHLSYMGDAVIGNQVNIGAGTITCNYDGANKHQTVIEDGAFVGSGVQLIAPVTIEENATVGAGSTITKKALKDKLTLSRVEQKTIHGWHRPKKK